MIAFLGALHAIAAQRGDGLRAELLRPLTHSEGDMKAKCTSAPWSEPEGGHVVFTRSDYSSFASGSLPKGVLRFPANRNR